MITYGRLCNPLLRNLDCVMWVKTLANLKLCDPEQLLNCVPLTDPLHPEYKQVDVKDLYNKYNYYVYNIIGFWPQTNVDSSK